jgi:hypothetical protein
VDDLFCLFWWGLFLFAIDIFVVLIFANQIDFLTHGREVNSTAIDQLKSVLAECDVVFL